jgi:lysozyme family protein
MSDINISIKKTLVHEGGYTNNPADHGGPTNFGITQGDMGGINVANITEDQAIAYYKEHYVKQGYTEIQDQNVLDKLFDLGVLFGVGEAIMIMQSVVGTTQDGQFGPNTLLAVNKWGSQLLTPYKQAFVVRVNEIVKNNPSQVIFMKGWLNRINS